MIAVWDATPLTSFHSRGSRTEPHERAHGEAKAHEQEGAVLAFFRSNPGRWSPSQVHARMPATWPLTSVRRALTNLSDRDRYPNSLWPPLTKTAERVMGPFGRKEHTWELSEKPFESVLRTEKIPRG